MKKSRPEHIGVARTRICHECPLYLPETRQCNWLIINKGGSGTIQTKISDPRMSCADIDNRRWKSVPSYHAWYLQINLANGRLTSRELHEYTRTGIPWKGVQGTASLIQEHYGDALDIHFADPHAPKPDPPLKRAVLQAKIRALARVPNNYFHTHAHSYEIKEEYKTPWEDERVNKFFKVYSEQGFPSR